MPNYTPSTKRLVELQEKARDALARGDHRQAEDALDAMVPTLTEWDKTRRTARKVLDLYLDPDSIAAIARLTAHAD